jgi:hypothetical protein
MKPRILLIILSAVVVTNSCVQAQNSSVNNGAEKMIKEFYTKYCNLWKNTPSSVPANILHEKIDSLAQNYCTNSIRNEAKSWFEDGHDLFTNDWGIDLESLKSLSIVKDLTKSNTYSVSYIVESYPVSPDKPVKKQITLQVSVIKENDIYKINEVK